MCGIAGLYFLTSSPGGPLPEETQAALGRMNQAQAHRGPDDEGLWQSPDGRVGLGHRRLAIIDLSPAGHQPMGNEDGAVWLTYNGEVYNFRQLRDELVRLGHTFRSHTDSEVIIHAYEEWGTAAFLRFRGMFAFALWDDRRRRLYLVRDRFGIKPLYYYQDNEQLVFASEVRALARSGLFAPRKNSDALLAFLLLGSVPLPLTTLRQVQAVPAGHYLVAEGENIRLERYYDLWTDNSANGDRCRPASLRALLAEAVDLHLIADAPLGVFLSGGIDSSALVALGATGRKSRLATLSIIFAEAQYSEQRYQHLLAEKYHTEHHELTVTRDLFQEELPRVLAAMDQPSIDGVNTYFVTLMAKQAGLKAVLSGTGGDEIFCGYPHFQRARLLSWLPALGPLVRSLNGATRLLSGRWRKLPFLGLGGDWGLYLAIRGLFTPREVARLTGASLRQVEELAQSLRPPELRGHPVERLSRLEINGYLQNQLLKDTDCLSMAHGVETRLPFLDPELVSAVLASPPAGRLDTRVPKVLLTRALGDLLPPEVVYRPKMTFTFPFATWLQDWPGWETLSQGPLDRQVAAALLADYQSGRCHWSRPWALAIATQSMG